ncbi:MAG: hypothetical protein ACJ76J_14175 [Thermoanaerobaculia bacterium]
MSGDRFHLPWFKLNADFFISGRAAHMLPALVPARRTPRWSKLVLPAHVVAELRRLGGGVGG